MARDTDAGLREAIIETCREMNRRGINQGTSGNVSARSGEGFLITSSGVPYDAMEPGQIVAMDLDGGYRGDWLPSSEWRMHHDLYRARPEAGAIVHTHSVHATALSCLRRDVPAFHYMIGICGGATLRCSAYATFGTAALSEAMLAAMAGRSACLLANHGVIAFGDTLARALWRAVEVETLAHQYVVACQMGKPTILGRKEMKSVLARFASYGKQPHDLAPDDAPAVEAPVRRDVPRPRRKRPRPVA
jgi:L-fuculose-phosphate aldolase